MSLASQDFTTIVRNQVTAIQAKARQFMDFSVGSILLAISETNAAVILWLQSLLLQLLATTRAATSTAADQDSWVADYGITRLAALSATGSVTFSRYTATQQAVVPIGASVQTTDGTQTFTVTTDTTNTAYSATLLGYVINGGVSSVTVPVIATNAGIVGNVAISTITLLGQSIPSVDTVNNALAFTNGVDAESDIALRARFIAYLSSLSKATKSAIGYAITSVQSGIVYTLVEDQDYNGATDYGYFYVVFDDGSGNPSANLISTVSNAVDASRPVGTRFGVFGPTLVTVTVVASLTVSAGYTLATVDAIARTAVLNYINALTLGQTLAYTKLAQIIYESSPGITNVTGLQVNAATADIVPTAKQVLRPNTVTIS